MYRFSWTSAPFLRVVEDNPAFVPTGERESLPLTQPQATISPTAGQAPAIASTPLTSGVANASTAPLAPAALTATATVTAPATLSFNASSEDSRGTSDGLLEYSQHARQAVASHQMKAQR